MDIFAESYPHLEDGAIKDFKSIMISHGYWKDKCWNSTKHLYTFSTNTVIKFIAVDKLGKAKGPRRDVGFINEANHAMTWEVFDQLLVRTREIMWLDWNPSNEFWYDDRIKDNRDHDFLRLTYLDCLEALDPAIVEDIESHKEDKNWWLVYGQGYHGEIEGKIYNNWKIVDEVPHEARLERRGLDFGYSNDPTAIIDIYRYNGGYILDEQLCRKGMHNKDIVDVIKNLPDTLTVADSAEPKSIDEIKNYGINIIGCKKQAPKTFGSMSIKSGSEGSYVKWSIGIVQQQQISMTKRSVNLIKAYRNYLWDTDKDGKILNAPNHFLSDCMDAVRYGIVSLAPIITRNDFINNIPIIVGQHKAGVNPAR